MSSVTPAWLAVDSNLANNDDRAVCENDGCVWISSPTANITAPINCGRGQNNETGQSSACRGQNNETGQCSACRGQNNETGQSSACTGQNNETGQSSACRGQNNETGQSSACRGQNNETGQSSAGKGQKQRKRVKHQLAEDRNIYIYGFNLSAEEDRPNLISSGSCLKIAVRLKRHRASVSTCSVPDIAC